MSETRSSRSFPPHSPDFGGGMPILFFCCLLALSAPFISFLIYNNYGVIRFELAGIFLLFLALSLIFSTVSLFRKRALNIIAYGFVVVVFCDLAFAEFIKQDSLFQSLGLLFGLFCVAALVARFLSKACWQALAAFLLVYLTTTILAPETRSSAILPAVPVSSKDETGPRPVIHLILDEHLGLDGMPSDLPESAATRAEILSFYRRWGFRVYAQAFSEEFATKYSLQNLFAGRSGPVPPNPHGRSAKVSGTAALKPLADQGYRFIVSGIDHANICGYAGLTELLCRNYDALSIDVLKGTPLPPLQKTLLIAGSYLKQSTLYKLFLNAEIITAKHLRRFDIEFSLFEVEAYSLSTLSSDRQFQRIRDEVPQIVAGDYRLHHLILPHFPYALRADCSLRDVRDWQNYDSFLAEGFNSAETRRDKYRLYFAQLQCLYLRLETFMQELRANGLLENAVVLLHGDHGSRITVNHPPNTALTLITASDLVDSYATLFAVRAPGLAAGVDRTKMSIQKLFPALIASGFGPSFGSEVQSGVTDGPPMVNLRGGPPHRWLEMPAFGDAWYARDVTGGDN